MGLSFHLGRNISSSSSSLRLRYCGYQINDNCPKRGWFNHSFMVSPGSSLVFFSGRQDQAPLVCLGQAPGFFHVPYFVLLITELTLLVGLPPLT